MQTSFTDTHDSPPIPDGNDPSAPRSTHHGEATPRGVSARPSLARGRAGTRSMSGRGRCACREQRALRGGEIKGERRLAWHADGNVRQRQGWRLGKDQGAGKMDQGTDRTAVVRSIVPICGIRGRDLRGIRRIRGGDGGLVLPICGAARSRCTWPNVSASWNASANSARYEPHFDRDRNQSIRRRACASHIGSRPIPASRCRDISNNVTLRQLADADSSIAPCRFHLACCKKSSVARARIDARRHRCDVRPRLRGKAWVSGLRASR